MSPCARPAVFRCLTRLTLVEILPPSSVVYAGSCDKRVPLQRRTPAADRHDHPILPLLFVSYIAPHMLFIGLVALLSNFIPRTQDPDTPISRTLRPNHTSYCISFPRHWSEYLRTSGRYQLVTGYAVTLSYMHRFRS